MHAVYYGKEAEERGVRRLRSNVKSRNFQRGCREGCGGVGRTEGYEGETRAKGVDDDVGRSAVARGLFVDLDRESEP